MKTLLISMLTLFVFHAKAQVLVSGKITGQVTDNNNTPVPFATIKITTNDSVPKVVAEKIADENGNYQINLNTSGKYFFNITSVGYDSLRKEILIEKNTENLDFTLIKTSENLKDVTVTSSAAMIQRKPDRIIMQVENNPLSAGKSSMEMLNLAPGVLIYDNKIHINGNGGVRVMIDGKLLNLSGNDLTNYLNSLRAEDIKSVEVIPHPPAEYDAQGTGGLINIVLKKNRNTGVNGSVYANYTQGKYPGTSDGFNINYKKNKISLYGTGSYYYQKMFDNMEQYRNFPNGIFTAINNRDMTAETNRVQAGGSYDITDNQFINIEYNRSGSHYTDNTIANTFTRFTDNAAANIRNTGEFPGMYKSTYNNIGLKYQIKTDTLNSKFTLLADYTNNKINNSNGAHSMIYDAQNTLIRDTSFRNATPGEANIYTVDAKYAQGFKSGHILSFGAKLTDTKIENFANFEYLQNGVWQSSAEQNYQYNYNENIIAGYVNFEGEILKTNVQVGLRAENTKVQGMLYTRGTETPNPYDYFSLFPSVYLTKAVNKTGDNSVNFSYNRRFNRPSFHELNPYVGYADAYTIGMGNPYLKPEFNNSLEVGFTLKYQYMFSLNYTYGKDIINNVIRSDVNDPRIMIQQPINSGKSRNITFTAFAPVKITKWWNTQNTMQLSHQSLIAPEYHIEKPIAMVQSNHTFTIDKKTNFTLAGFYISNFLFANGIIEPFGSVQAGFTRKFFDDKLTFKVNVNDIFYTQRIRGRLTYNDFNLDIKTRQQSRFVTVGLTYNFKAGKAFKVNKLESSNSEEQKRLEK